MLATPLVLLAAFAIACGGKAEGGGSAKQEDPAQTTTC
jgi:hypothetical protein